MKDKRLIYYGIGIGVFVAICVVLFYVGKAQGRAKTGTKK